MALSEIIPENRPLIITVTLNPVLDRTLWVKNFRAGETFIAYRSENFAGGKGVNVSRALLKFRVPSIATGIIPKRGNEIYIELLKRDGILHNFYFTEGFLRTNITIVSSGNKQETHIRVKGPSISESTLKGFMKKLNMLFEKNFLVDNKNLDSDKKRSESTPNPICILSGSIPQGLGDDTYSKLIHHLKEKGTLVFLDSSGEAFKRGIAEKPYFIKPNLEEVRDALGFLPDSDADIRKAFDLLHRIGIEQVMITRGKDGLLFSKGNSIVNAYLRINNPLNTVGSGDAALAGGVLGYIHNMNTEETARLACALGAANTLTAGACRFLKEDVLNFVKKVTIEKW
ncbi:MAG: 1-phosphofructokinase family hexose kinase [Spirochaetota bacterium]